MKEHIKIAGKIVLKSVAVWALIAVLGCVITLISFLISFLFNIDLLFVEDLTFTGYVKTLLYENFPALIIIFGSPIFVVVYIVMAKKVSIQNSIYLLFQSKSGEKLLSVLNDAVDKITQKKGRHSELLDKAMLKMKVLQAIKDNPETSSFQRSIIQYGFRKVNLEDVDFHDENVSLSSILTSKFSQFFAEVMKPSLRFFWMLISAQMVLSIWSLFL
ncbi:MAG: hypothetical protein HWE22_05000 [Flavobacteriales bacterium]|nr:hypothetical protein [Flavobacteriales bacterium]